MNLDIRFEILGLEALKARLADPQVFQALTRRMEMACIILEDAAKTNAPKNTGRLASSIAHKIEGDASRVQGRVGPNVQKPPYGNYMEYGTGLLSDFPGGSRKPHFPPPAALERWAHLHGFPPGGGFLVARAIARRGGLAPRRYLRNALRDNLGKITEILCRAARDVAERIGR